MTLDTMVEVIRNFVEVLALLVAGAVTLFFFLSFTPNLSLRISPQWTPGVADVCVLKLTVENTSRVRVQKKSIRLGISNFTRADIADMTEMFRFTETNSKEICGPTEFIYPGKRIEVDWIVRFDFPEELKHVGLQVEGVRSAVAAILNREWDRPPRWTTTAIVIPPPRGSASGTRNEE